MIYTKNRPDGFTVKAFVLEHCDCKNCARADPKSEDYTDFTELLNQYLFREAQKNVRKAKLELASEEQSYDNLTKRLDKKI